MILRCCRCGIITGEKEPLLDETISHTYCEECAKKELVDLEKLEDQPYGSVKWRMGKTAKLITIFIVFVTLSFGLARPGLAADNPISGEQLRIDAKGFTTHAMFLALDEAAWIVNHIEELKTLALIQGELEPNLLVEIVNATIGLGYKDDGPDDTIKSIPRIDREGGDCEDLAIYTLAHLLFTSANRYLGLIAFTTKDGYGHIAVVVVLNKNILVIDTTMAEDYRVLPIEDYLKTTQEVFTDFAISYIGE